MDSRKKSLSEGLINLIPGFIIAYSSTFVILPPFTEGIKASDPLILAIIALSYTGISLLRMYVLRRLFARLGENENLYTLIKRLGKKI